MSALLITGCGAGKGDPASVSSAPNESTTETLDVSGTLVVSGEGARGGGPCFTSGGYGDIDRGAQVTVYSATSEAIALGNVSGNGVTAGRDCTFAFDVYDVPKQDGSAIYAAEVGNRGQVQFTEDEAASLVFTLG